MRIGIDCRLSGNTHAGIGRYIEHLIVRLPTLVPKVEWVFFFFSEDQIPQSLKSYPNVSWVLAPVRHYTLAEQWQLPGIFKSAQLDLLHVPHFNIPLWYHQPLVVTIHDLLWHEYKGAHVTTLTPWKYWFKYLAYRFVTQKAVAKAKQILVPTQTVKKTLTGYYPEAEAKTVVTLEGVEGTFANRNEKQENGKIGEKENGKMGKQLVYVGSLYPHKNIQVVLQALQQLPDYQLHLVGARNVFQDEVTAAVQKLGVQSQVVFHGYLPDEKLVQLLHQSQALIQPSLSEGFGLTGVEAMAAGVPVIASDIPIFREVYQDGAIFFDPHSSNDLVQTLKRLTPTQQQQLRLQGQHVAQQYSWDTMAEQTVAVYRQALKT